MFLHLPVSQSVHGGVGVTQHAMCGGCIQHAMCGGCIQYAMAVSASGFRGCTLPGQTLLRQTPAGESPPLGRHPL